MSTVEKHPVANAGVGYDKPDNISARGNAPVSSIAAKSGNITDTPNPENTASLADRGKPSPDLSDVGVGQRNCIAIEVARLAAAGGAQ